MSDLISDEYLDQLHKMRAANYRPTWGNGGQRHAMAAHAVIVANKAKTVLDYGCGHGKLLEALQKLSYHEMPAFFGYDPGIPERAALPAPADVLVSTDVLEHIEPDKLDNVLEHIRQLTLKAAYINVHTGPANAKLPDGRNAHLIQNNAAWWGLKLRDYFNSVERVPGFDGHRPSFLCA